MFKLMEALLAYLSPTWARYQREQALLVPLEDVIRADDDLLK
ncbi:MAG TPA: hypothetical protein VGX71_27455 [Pseudaminobacter sp.]|jgi:hypothetical protein|nr:hypothetical protein [Pseudaminobacter sp.]